MKPLLKALFAVAALSTIALMSVPAQETKSAAKKGGGKKAGPPPQVVWSPKSTKLVGWTAPHKPLWKLSEILASQKGKANWTVNVVNDEHLHADYIQLAP